MDNRKRIAEENPTKKGRKVLTLCAKAWKELTVDDKEPYTSKATKDKARYAEEMEAYREKKALEEKND